MRKEQDSRFFERRSIDVFQHIPVIIGGMVSAVIGIAATRVSVIKFESECYLLVNVAWAPRALIWPEVSVSLTTT